MNVIIFLIIYKKNKSTNIKSQIIETNLLLRTNKKIKTDLIKSNIIHAFYSMGKKYYIPIIVSMTSIMKNQKNSTILHFHLLCMNDFTLKIKTLILELKQGFKNCEISFYNMNNSFDWAKTRLENQNIFPLKLPDILRTISKIIFGIEYFNI